MDVTVHICPQCLRMHDGDGKVMPFRIQLPVNTPCRLQDCADEAARRAEFEARRKAKRKARFEKAGAGQDRAVPNGDRE